MSDNNNNSGGQSLGGGPSNDTGLPAAWDRPAAPRVGRVGQWTAPAPTSSGRRMVTLSDLANSGNPPAGNAHGSDNEDDDEPENLFAGGERSGLNVQNPNAVPSIPGGNIVRDMLRRAAEAGPGRGAEPLSSTPFSGGGHKLGSDEVESSYIPDPDAADEDETDEVAIRHLTFWREGFSIENGPLMRFDDPGNEQILEDINTGQAPPSVLNVRFRQRVELRVSKRLTDDFVPNSIPVNGNSSAAWTGTGNRLGATIPAFAPSTSEPSSRVDESRRPATFAFEVDQSMPTTSVQIRLADGTRIVARMNLTHTVGDIRGFIDFSRPENVTRPYTIGTTFPTKILEDDTVTIEGAKLAGCVVVQRWV